MDYGHEVKFGVFAVPATMNPKRALDVAAIADELGYDLIGVQDHPYQWRFFDTWTLLVAIAMGTERITVFPDVASLPMRPPAVLAKAAASLDVLSGGRAELGLGAGGFWEAIKAMGGAARTPAQSVSALEEAIHVVKLIWSGERNLRFQGQFYSLSGVNAGPKPVHAMGVWLGAYRPRMLGITGRLADGWVPSFGNLQPPDLIAANERIDAAARAAARDPKTIRRVLNIGVPIDESTADLLTTLAVDCGMDSFLIAEGGDDPRDDLGHFMREVAPRVREQVARKRESSRPA